MIVRRARHGDRINSDRSEPLINIERIEALPWISAPVKMIPHERTGAMRVTVFSLIYFRTKNEKRIYRMWLSAPVAARHGIRRAPS